MNKTGIMQEEDRNRGKNRRYVLLRDRIEAGGGGGEIF
jgi:hypothetical protein